MLGSLHTSDVRRYIPRLIHVGEATLSKGGKDRIQQLFTLDWKTVDAYKEEQYLSWRGESHEEEVDGPPYAYNSQVVVHIPPPTLPEEYDSKVKGLAFALPRQYHEEIEHFTKLFLMEYCRKRNFDTCVRDRCYSTAVSAIGNAFYLLIDCLFNLETGSWYRGPYKRVYQHLVTYKFWSGFTGRGLCWNHSGLDQLSSQLAYMLDCGGDRETAEIYSKVIADMRLYEENLEKFYEHTSIELPSDEGK